MESRDEQIRWISTFSGFASGVLKTFVGHPFDTMKVMAQTRQLAKSNGVSYTEFSLKRLYKGLAPPMLSYGLFTSLNFAIYENLRLSLLEKYKISDDYSDEFNKLAVIFCSATLSGGVVVLLTSPFDNLKVIQQTRESSGSDRLHYARKLLKQGNPFRGIVPNLIVQGIGRGFYIGGYTITLDIEERFSPGYSQTFVGKVIAASVAGISGWFFPFPFDMVRSNMMADYKGIKYKTTLGCLKSIYANGGIKTLYSGLGYTLIRAVPVAIAALVTYDYSQRFLLRHFHDNFAQAKSTSS